MLKKPLDSAKDQTYYLSSISEEGLSRALFPLSRLTKGQVRTLANEWRLPTATRDESMGLCFVGERRKFSGFLCQFLSVSFIVPHSDSCSTIYCTQTWADCGYDDGEASGCPSGTLEFYDWTRG